MSSMGVIMEQLTTIGNKKIIITNQVAETNKFLRQVVKDKSKSLFDFEVKSLSEIAQEVYFAYNSLYAPEIRKTVVSGNIQAVRLMAVLKEGNYTFLSEKSKDISSAKEILRILNEIRMNEPSEFYLSSNETRISELRKIQSAYEKSLEGNNELDLSMLYSSATDCLSKIDNLEILMPAYIGATYIDMWYENMTGVERTFLEVFLGKQNAVMEKMSSEGTNAENQSYTFIKSYGVFNEVNFVKDEILSKNMPLGQVAIVYPTPDYEMALMAILGNAGISYSFAKGFSAKSTSYVQLMISLLEFAKGDYDCRGLDTVVDNSALIIKDKRKQYRSFVRNRVGWKRERYVDFFNSYEKKEEDTFIEFMEKVIDCFDETKSCDQIFHCLVKIANEYTDTRDIYRASLKDSFRLQEKVFSLAASESFAESLKLIGDYLDTLSCAISERPDMVSLLPFGGEEMIDRDNLFVLGLSNENIARTLVESPVLCDDDLGKCTVNKARLAMEANKRRIDAFERMLQSSSAKNIYFGYSYYDTVALLDCSASLLYLDKLDMVGLTKNDIKTVTYKLNINAKKLDVTSFSAIEIETDDENAKFKKEVETPWNFSASSLQELLSCPLEYYYAHILHIPVVEHMDRMPDKWLPANKRGDIFHHTMENYINEAVIEKGSIIFDENIFNKYFDEEVIKARVENPVPSETVFEDERDEAREVAVKFITKLLEELSSSNKKIIGCEVSFADVPYKDRNFDIVFRGAVDRLDGEVDVSGVLQLDIVDYKTGRASRKKEEIKAGVQIQHYVYAIAMLDWAAKNKSQLESYFGKTIKNVAIRSVKYVFPYDVEEDEVDATEYVLENQCKLTDGIADVLLLTIGMLQQGKEQEMLAFAQAVASGKKEADKAFCQYCQYTNVCRG